MKKIAMFLLLVFIAGFFFSCATTPEAARPVETQPPEWIYTLPQPDMNRYFVGYSTDAATMEEAENLAKSMIIGDIMLFIGSSVTSNVESEIQSTLDTLEVSLTENLTSEGSANLSGFFIQDKWVEESGSGYTVYLLGAYNLVDLNGLKNQFEEALREKEEAVTGPELEGDQLAAAGDILGAVMKYLEAAYSAANSDIGNAELKFNRDINKANTLLSDISIIPLQSTVAGFAGTPLDGPLVSKIVVGATVDDTPIAGVPVRVSYQQLGRNGRLSTRGVNLLSDSEGLITFEHPVPDFVDTATVTFALDLSTYLEPLETVNSTLMTAVISLDDMISGIRATTSVVSQSNASSIPMGIVVLDADTARTAYGTSDASAGLLESLADSGFDIRVLDYDPAELLNLSDSRLIGSIENEFGEGVDRLVFGIVNIADFDDTDEVYTVKVSGLIKVADLESGEILFSRSMIKNARGSSLNGVIAAAFRQLGAAIGDVMVSELW